MSITLSALQKQRRDTAANWTSANPTLLAGEIGIESDTGYWKVGDGSTVWNSLAYLSGLGGEIPVSRLADGSARQLLQTAANGNDVEWTSNVDVPGTLDVTSAATFDSSVAVTGALTKSGNNVVTVGDTGTVTSTMILDGTILNADVNASAGIVDTKLATISTAGKVSNSATTATSASTASTIVARDASGNFTAGTITAALTGAASSNVLKAGDTMTGVLAVTAGTAALPAITPSGDPNTGIYSPGADQVAISTNGTGRLFVNASGNVGLGVAPKTWSGGAIGALFNGSGSITAFSDEVSYGNNVYFNGAWRYARSDTAQLLQLGSGDIPLIFYSAASGTADASITWSERFRIDSSGRLGLGVSNPSVRLEVRDTIAGGSDNTIATLHNLSDTGADTRYAGLNFRIGSDNGTSAIRAFRTNSATDYRTDLSFWTNPSGATQTPVRAMTIDYLQRVGIGTTSPAQLLHIQSASNPAYFARDTRNNVDAYLYASQTVGIVGTSSPHPLVFNVENLEKARIDTSGRLLVGTSSTSGPALLTVQGYSGSSTGEGIVSLQKGAATPANGDSLGVINFTNNAANAGAQIYAQRDGGTWTSGSSHPGRLVFSTTADGASSSTERMRISQDGSIQFSGPLNFANVNGSITGSGGGTDYIGVRDSGSNFIFRAITNGTGIGNLLVGYSASNGAYKLQVNSQIFATSATIATSDGRYKENVASLGGCLDLVKALRPVSFTWKPQHDISRTDEDGNQVLVREGHNFPNGTQVGFIAQEVREVLAEKPWLTSVIKENVRPAISDDDGNELAPKEEFLGIAEGNLIAVLTSALQETVAEIQFLKDRVTALESA